MDKSQITVKAYDEISSAYQEKFMDIHLYDDTYDKFCTLIKKKNAKVFEIGCGPGNITKYLLAKRPYLKIEAIDLSPNMIRLAKANNPTADFKMMDCRKIDEIHSRFDAIMCGFCIPYLSKEECTKLIKDCSNLLNNSGVIYLSMIEGDYNNSGYELSSNGQFKMYVYYHSADNLQKGLKENGFELIDLKRIDYPKGDGLESHMVLIARKNK
jgi:2-polyprenyl-3-methyl-5-hydroxy-6-metoxy-1,4-benzoquinol methylase